MQKKYWLFGSASLIILVILFIVYFNFNSNDEIIDQEGSCKMGEECNGNTNSSPKENDISQEEVVKPELEVIKEELTGSYLDKNYSLKLLEIHGDDDYLLTINQDLLNNYQEFKDDPTENALYETTYFYNQNKDLVSLMVKYYGFIPETSFKTERYFIYNFSLETKKLLSTEEFLKYYDLNEDEIISKLKTEYDTSKIKITGVYLNEDHKINVIFPLAMEGTILYKVYEIN